MFTSQFGDDTHVIQLLGKHFTLTYQLASSISFNLWLFFCFCKAMKCLYQWWWSVNCNCLWHLIFLYRSLSVSVSSCQRWFNILNPLSHFDVFLWVKLTLIIRWQSKVQTLHGLSGFLCWYLKLRVSFCGFSFHFGILIIT